MSTTTTNLGFVKPELTDAADITKMNGNWDKIDENLGQRRLKTYTSLDQIGLSGAVTMDNVFNALPDSSMLVFGNTNAESSVSYITDVPAQYGVIEAIRYSATRTTARFTRADDGGVQQYVGKFHSSEGWSGWCKDYNSASKPTLSELGAASSADQNTKHFTAFNQIGLLVGSETVESITTHLPDNGKIALNITKGTNANIYPADYGSLEVHRITQYRVAWTFTAKPAATSDLTIRYIGYSYVGDNNQGVHWTGWQQVVTKTDIPTLNVATYTSLEQIGLTEGSETIAEIAKKLPVNSMLYYTVNATSNVSEFPNSNYGLLVVDKTVNSRLVFTFTNNLGQQWVGTYSINTNGDTWTGWGSVYNANAPIILTQYQHYGINLPDPGTAGRVFFKVVG